jgi:predicted hydrocarbon binding protein
VSFTSESFPGFIDVLENKVEAVKQLGQDIDYETEPYSQAQIQRLAELAERIQIRGNACHFVAGQMAGFLSRAISGTSKVIYDASC